MNIAIFSNQSLPSIGGCETVIYELAKAWSQLHNVSVFSSSIKEDTVEGDVKYSSIRPWTLMSVSDVVEASSGFDVLFVYSDLCHAWPNILAAVPKIPGKVFLVPLGAYRSRHDQKTHEMTLAYKDCISLINHSDNYEDADYCNENDIKFETIYNGVNLETFKQSLTKEEFVSKFGLMADHKFILYVGNFFPGKGHEELSKIALSLKEVKDGFTLLVVASKTNFRMMDMMMSSYPGILNQMNIPYKCLYDMDRQDVIDSFYISDVFVSPSRKEVSPIVILESMTAGLPWISAGVGNVRELPGGVVIETAKTEMGHAIFDEETRSGFVRNINGVLNNNLWAKALSKDGRKHIVDYRNWKDIADKYIVFFQKQLAEGK